MKTALLSLSICLIGSPVLAGEVQITKSHICCAGCVKAIEDVLGKTEGVTEVKVNEDEKSLTFEATDAKVAKKAVRQLAKAGFGGEAKHEGKIIKLPTPQVEADVKADEVKLTRIHLCCGACVKAVEGAVATVEGVEKVTCDQDEGTCTATGKDVSLIAVLQSLRDAGFNGTLPGEKKAGKKKNKTAE